MNDLFQVSDSFSLVQINLVFHIPFVRIDSSVSLSDAYWMTWFLFSILILFWNLNVHHFSYRLSYGTPMVLNVNWLFCNLFIIFLTVLGGCRNSKHHVHITMIKGREKQDSVLCQCFKNYSSPVDFSLCLNGQHTSLIVWKNDWLRLINIRPLYNLGGLRIT
jgi:hypothetical protein